MLYIVIALITGDIITIKSHFVKLLFTSFKNLVNSSEYFRSGGKGANCLLMSCIVRVELGSVINVTSLIKVASANRSIHLF